jgi:SAM-dependent methyltransferase
VEFLLADGEELEAEPESFDATTCRWGIMFMPEPLRCLGQAYSALKPGGRVAFAAWGPPERNPFISLPAMVLGKYLETPPPNPTLPGGVFSFAAPGKLESAFAEAGFRDVKVDGLELPMAVFDSGQEYWQFQREIAGPLATMFAQLPPAAQQAAEEEIIQVATRGHPEGKVSLNGYTLVASAVK